MNDNGLRFLILMTMMENVNVFWVISILTNFYFLCKKEYGAYLWMS